MAHMWIRWAWNSDTAWHAAEVEVTDRFTGEAEIKEQIAVSETGDRCNAQYLRIDHG